MYLDTVKQAACVLCKCAMARQEYPRVADTWSPRVVTALPRDPHVLIPAPGEERTGLSSEGRVSVLCLVELRSFSLAREGRPLSYTQSREVR